MRVNWRDGRLFFLRWRQSGSSPELRSPVARHLELEKLLELFYGRFVWFHSTSRKNE